MAYKRHRTVDEGARLVAPMFKRGLKISECAELLGVRKSSVSRYKERAREMGLLEVVRPGVTADLRAIKSGNIWNAVEALDYDVKKWILDNIPKGATLVEFAFACLVDQYFDEVDP
jgi:transposase